MKLHPTKKEVLELIDYAIENNSCNSCKYTDNTCGICICKISNGISCGGIGLTQDERLTALAFLITMPASIRKSLEEGVKYEV